ncbi:MAG: hypothetical protein CMO01_28850 [Thalassobius sp.]|nr:hypothetical protein [Thalassovita sp.]
MWKRNILRLVTLVLVLLVGCKDDDSEIGSLELLEVFAGNVTLSLSEQTENIPTDQNISLVFSNAVDQSTAQNYITLSNETGLVDFDVNYLSNGKNVVLYPLGGLEDGEVYTIIISSELKGAAGESFASSTITFKTAIGNLKLSAVRVDEIDILGQNQLLQMPLDFELTFIFSNPINEADFTDAIELSGPDAPALTATFSNENKTIVVTATEPLKYLSPFQLEISESLQGTQGETFAGYQLEFYTEVDETPKFPILSAEELLTKVQSQTFKYFWDFAHPESGMIRERNTSGNTVTTGGTGFGLMAIITGIERGFITREQGIERLNTIVDFLENADRFHGAWSHWLNGSTGEVIPFSTNDDGGDLVETSFLVMGLLTTKQYLDTEDITETQLADKITSLCDSVQWDWYTQGENALTWHWSPNYGFEKDLQISGWNEALITYLMAASSTTYPISKEVYDEGWWTGSTENGNSYYSLNLPLGPDYGGPLFFEHYSFLGIDPRNLSDGKVDYWEQVVNHTKINQLYCAVNPKNYAGYSEDCWGLTASDGDQGYSAHSPTNDRGVITPTAALSSIAYTPEASTDALNYFYYTMGDRLWGDYGFYDAFNPSENWYASSYLAIDQGPIIIMIENYRSGLLWDLFMSNSEVQQGLDKLGFTY